MLALLSKVQRKLLMQIVVENSHWWTGIHTILRIECVVTGYGCFFFLLRFILSSCWLSLWENRSQVNIKRVKYTGICDACWTYIAKTLTICVLKREPKYQTESCLGWTLFLSIQYACQWFLVVTLFSLFLDVAMKKRDCNYIRTSWLTRTTFVYVYGFVLFLPMFTLYRTLLRSFGTSLHRRCVEEHQEYIWNSFRVYHGIST